MKEQLNGNVEHVRYSGFLKCLVLMGTLLSSVLLVCGVSRREPWWVILISAILLLACMLLLPYVLFLCIDYSTESPCFLLHYPFVHIRIRYSDCAWYAQEANNVDIIIDPRAQIPLIRAFPKATIPLTCWMRGLPRFLDVLKQNVPSRPNLTQSQTIVRTDRYRISGFLLLLLFFGPIALVIAVHPALVVDSGASIFVRILCFAAFLSGLLTILYMLMAKVIYIPSQSFITCQLGRFHRTIRFSEIVDMEHHQRSGSFIIKYRHGDRTKSIRILEANEDQYRLIKAYRRYT